MKRIALGLLLAAQFLWAGYDHPNQDVSENDIHSLIELSDLSAAGVVNMPDQKVLRERLEKAAEFNLPDKKFPIINQLAGQAVRVKKIVEAIDSIIKDLLDYHVPWQLRVRRDKVEQLKVDLLKAMLQVYPDQYERLDESCKNLQLGSLRRLE